MKCDVDIVSADGTMSQEIDMCVMMELIELAPSTSGVQVVNTACTRRQVTSRVWISKRKKRLASQEGDKGRMTREPESDHEDDPVNARDPEVGVR